MYPSLALDPQGNPRISYYNTADTNLMYADASVNLVNPSGGTTWVVGDLETIEWKGAGEVDLLLSVDGGDTFDRLLTGVTENTWTLRVPHTPTRYGVLRIQREEPFSTAEMPCGGAGAFLTIEAIIDAIDAGPFHATWSDGNVVLSWETDPGPEAQIAYRLERAYGEGGTFAPLHAGLLRELTYVDHDAPAAARYRLIAVNGLGEEFVLGETRLGPAHSLWAWPLPYRGGELQIAFTVYGPVGDAGGDAQVTLYDATGRLVRTLARGRYEGPQHVMGWDGRNESGQPIGSGMYFIRAVSSGHDETLRILAIR
jgi:hypothetical protein